MTQIYIHFPNSTKRIKGDSVSEVLAKPGFPYGRLVPPYPMFGEAFSLTQITIDCSLSAAEQAALDVFT